MLLSVLQFISFEGFGWRGWCGESFKLPPSDTWLTIIELQLVTISLIDPTLLLTARINI